MDVKKRMTSKEGILSSLLVLVAALLLAAHGHPGSASAEAQAGSMIGIDVIPDSNTPASLGPLETCASHAEGDEFAVDIFVNNVSSLRSWELRVQYDEDVLEVAEVDYAHFLISTAPGGNIFPTLREAEAPGRDFLAAAELQGPADTGSGVLARLSVRAIGEGTSPIRVVGYPSYFGPRLSGAGAAAIGDDDGDGIWDGSLLDGEVIVGGSCGSAPVVTAKPSPAPTPRSSSAPGATQTPAATGSGGEGTEDSDGDPVATSSTSGVVVIGPPGIGGGSSDISGQEPGDPVGDPGNEPRTGDGNDPPGADDAENDSDGTLEGSNAGASSDDGSAGKWLSIVGIAAAAFVALGGLLFGMSKRHSS